MKKLIILSALALLAAPCFSTNNTISDIAKDNKAFLNAGGETTIAEEGDTVSSNPTIYFGDKIGNSYKSTAESKWDSLNATVTGLEIDSNNCSLTNCYIMSSDGYALKMGASKKSGSMTITFAKLNIKKVNIYASDWSANEAPQYKLSAENGYDGTAIAVTTVKSDTTDFQLLSWPTADEETTSIGETTSITFAGMLNKSNKCRICVQKIEFELAESTTKYAVSYDYKMDDMENVTEQVESGKCATGGSLKEGDKHSTWDTTYEFAGWYKEDETKFDLAETITADIKLHAKWNKVSESENILNLQLSETKRQLSYTYDVTTSENSDDKIYSISNIALRFGGTLEESLYEILESHIKTFGIVYTTSLPDGYETLTDALGAGISESEFTVKTQDFTETMKPVKTTISNETYYLWNVYLNVPSESIKKTVYAVATLSLDNGKSYYLQEGSASVETLAFEYFDSTESDNYTEDELETLMLLAEGKTKTEVTSSSETEGE